MLNKAERFEVLRVIRYCCKLGLLPAQVDLSTWQILPHANRMKTWMCHFWFFLFVLHALYKIGSLGYWLKTGIALHEAVVHTVLAIVALYVYWYSVLYIRYPNLFGVYLNMTLTGDRDAVDGQNKRSWSRRLKECTLQDLFAMTVAYTVSLAIADVLVALICYPSMKLLLYAALPKEHQTWITSGILFLEEVRYLMVVWAVITPVWILQVISFDLVGNNLQLLVDSMQSAAPPQSSRRVYRSLRHIQLYMGIVNLINCFLIFTTKFICITICIGTGYAAIAHFNEYPLFGVMYYLIFLNAGFIYILCYDKAFKIPALFQKATERAMLVTLKENSQASKVFNRQIRSIPRMGIKVGEFHLMERESTLNFIHFVVNNIVAMLLAFRDG